MVEEEEEEEELDFSACPAELHPSMEEMGSVFVGETEYFDLKDPWLHSPEKRLSDHFASGLGRVQTFDVTG